MGRYGRSAGITGLLGLAREAGLDAYRLAAEARVPAAALTDPDLRVSAVALRKLVERVAEFSGMEDFGLRLAEARPLSNWGALALAVREQPTLRRALALITEYMPLHTESYVPEVEEADDTALLRLNARSWGSRHIPDLCLGVFCLNLRRLLGSGWLPVDVLLVHPAPRSLDAHLRVFGKIPRFEQSVVALLIARSDLERRISDADAELATAAERHLVRVAALPADFSGQVREIIVVLLPTGQCTAERAAERLGIRRRMLHRRLAAEGASFSKLVDAARISLATALLRDTRRSIRAISVELGYSGVSAFSHWFRRRFQCAPSKFRRAGVRPQFAAE